MISMDDANSIKRVRDISNLDGELDKLLIAVALTESFTLQVFANESKLGEICAEGPFKLKGSGISSFDNKPLPSRWGASALAVGNAVAQSLDELAKEIAIHPGDRVFEESEQPKGTRTLSTLELELESPIAEAGALADLEEDELKKLVLTVALLEDATVRVFKSDRARKVVEGKLFSRADNSDCCKVHGHWLPRRLCRIPDNVLEVVLLWFNGQFQQLGDF